MSRLADELPLDKEAYEPFEESASGPRTTPRQDGVNFLTICAHLILVRVGWIYKTESIVMPVFLQYAGARPWLLGFLPVLNRLGFAVPPVLYSQRLKLARKKKWSVVTTTLAMAAPFAALSALWFSGVWRAPGGGHDAKPWAVAVFLLLYAVFFAVTGMNQLAVHTLQGKLIPARVRGRHFMASVVVGAPLAVFAAWATLPGWLSLPDGGFGYVFAAVAGSFVLAAAVTAFAQEPPDLRAEQSTTAWQKFHGAWRVLRDDARLRGVGLVAALVGANFMLFPHYQSLGDRELEQDLSAMMGWVCAQNAATAVFSMIVGPVADRVGNRAALRFSVFGLALAPLVSLGLAYVPFESAQGWFWLAFTPIGFMPVTFKLLVNYTLELAEEADHPQYVSAVGMCIALPVIVGSPLVGLMVEWVGLKPVFLGGLCALAAAWLQTLRLEEPRHDAQPGHRTGGSGPG